MDKAALTTGACEIYMATLKENGQTKEIRLKDRKAP
jgi:hypothetical protein